MDLLICLSCSVNPSDPSIKSDLPQCKDCYQKTAALFQSYKEQRWKNGKMYPQISEIIPNKLYLGNEDAAQIKEILETNGITHILVAGSHLNQAFKGDYTYKALEIDDSLKEDLLPLFDDTFEFIESGKTVFVHCAAGVSRSGSIVIAYLMRKLNLTFENAFSMAKKLRPIVSPNSNFKNQLKEYEVKLEINNELR